MRSCNNIYNTITTIQCYCEYVNMCKVSIPVQMVPQVQTSAEEAAVQFFLVCITHHHSCPPEVTPHENHLYTRLCRQPNYSHRSSVTSNLNTCSKWILASLIPRLPDSGESLRTRLDTSLNINPERDCDWPI